MKTKKTSKAPVATKKTSRPAPAQETAPFSAPDPSFEKAITVDQFKKTVEFHLRCTLARDKETARQQDWFYAVSYAIRDFIHKKLIDTQERYVHAKTRRCYYMSLEFLMGRLLRNNLISTKLYGVAVEAMKELGLDPEVIMDEEKDMALGNGGLGRLAACFLDSLATLGLPSVGYGIHYEFGLFRQTFKNGYQVETADNWLVGGNPWHLRRSAFAVEVPIYGNVTLSYDENGNFRPRWINTKSLLAVPWDIPIVGYGAKTVNYLRLWEAKATRDFDFNKFNEGNYIDAIREKASNETISKVLYPNDKSAVGRQLRLVQQIFFVSASLQDIIRRHKKENGTLENLADKVAIQLNDTHPTIAIPEMMRLLIDVEGFSWEKAWDLVTKIFAYTNHTLLPEALERWSVPLFETVLPRHLQIVYEINRRFLAEVEKQWPGDDQKKRELSIIEEGMPKQVRMATLAVVACHSTNGVAALHTELLKQTLFSGLYELYPERFNNKTNGITPRRWLRSCNLGLSKLIDETIGDDWTADLDKLQQLGKYADNANFRKRYAAVKRENKVELARIIKELCGIEVSPDALFDVQIKRLHEYKRQHLNLLHILTLYHRLLNDPKFDMVPRVFVFGAKAAPGYDLAKHIIHAINAVGAKINNDPRVKGKIKVAFIPDYRVSLAEKIIPAADLSEQISTAGKEASGTGNMKLALNGALTIGTLDGANVEIKEEVGDENIFIFGLTVDEVKKLHSKGYSPWDYYNNDNELRAVLGWLAGDYFTPEAPHSLAPVVRSLLEGGDPFLVLADYRSYIECQERVDKAFRDKDAWTKAAILNTARVGKFSSDRTIKEYAQEIWDLDPLTE
ncbi:MAG: glycogen/starch/alpha-glucan phosphorylase [Opitutales bacterium]|nr:glycogen/starch/alpha-glucan phosphorylase [Opitutales bacterium]